MLQGAIAIYVLACLSDTRPTHGRYVRDTHCDQVVRYRARFARGFYCIGGQTWLLEL